MRTFEYARAADVEQAIALHARTPETAYLAGGTTLLDLMKLDVCLLYTSPSPRDGLLSRMPSSA